MQNTIMILWFYRPEQNNANPCREVVFTAKFGLQLLEAIKSMVITFEWGATELIYNLTTENHC